MRVGDINSSMKILDLDHLLELQTISCVFLHFCGCLGWHCIRLEVRDQAVVRSRLYEALPSTVGSTGCPYDFGASTTDTEVSV